MGWRCPVAYPELGFSGKCDCYSVVGGDTSLFLPVEQDPSLEDRLQGPIGNWTTDQETKPSQRRTTAWGTERLTAHSLDTRHQNCSSKTTSRAPFPLCLPAICTNMSEKGLARASRVVPGCPWELVTAVDSRNKQIHIFYASPLFLPIFVS